MKILIDVDSIEVSDTGIIQNPQGILEIDDLSLLEDVSGGGIVVNFYRCSSYGNY